MILADVRAAVAVSPPRCIVAEGREGCPAAL